MSQQNASTFKPQRALISVSDKTNLTELAHILVKHQVEILATGHTAAILKEEKIPVTEVSAYTKFPEILDGRVKTLHPAIHAGILARGEEDEPTLQAHQFNHIDLVIVNLYPFEQTISSPDCHYLQAIEQIDIGGPTLIRAAAKNNAHRFVLVSPEDYQDLYQYLNDGAAPENWRFLLAKKAFSHTAAYDAAISNYLGTLDDNFEPSSFPEILTKQFIKHKDDLRYGENPHQQAIYYAEKNTSAGTLAKAALIQGKALSYNNLLDADAAYSSVNEFDSSCPAAVIVKHTNPCGVALGSTILQAYERAFQADPQSAFGGIIALNQVIDQALAKTILKNQFAEVIIAPALSPEARAVFKQKENLRVLITGAISPSKESRLDLRQIDGGILLQEHDSALLTIEDLEIVTETKPDDETLPNLLFAWKVVKHVKSNAIVYAKNEATIGIGAGQSSRVMSAKIGLMLAEQFGFQTTGAVMASDAFLPFPDTISIAALAGISAIIQPGGSIRDKEVIDCANEHGISMVFTGIRHFKH